MITEIAEVSFDNDVIKFIEVEYGNHLRINVAIAQININNSPLSREWLE